MEHYKMQHYIMQHYIMKVKYVKYYLLTNSTSLEP